MRGSNECTCRSGDPGVTGRSRGAEFSATLRAPPCDLNERRHAAPEVRPHQWRLCTVPRFLIDTDAAAQRVFIARLLLRKRVKNCRPFSDVEPRRAPTCDARTSSHRESAHGWNIDLARHCVFAFAPVMVKIIELATVGRKPPTCCCEEFNSRSGCGSQHVTFAL